MKKNFYNLRALLHPVRREERADCFIICFLYIGNLPPPTSAEEVGARVLAQERLEKKGVSVYEPQHVITNSVVCATSKGSDQPAHTRRLIRAFGSRLNIL